jgi:hypothetical protein
LAKTEIGKRKRGQGGYTIRRAADWSALTKLVAMAEAKLRPDQSETLWFRGTSNQAYTLEPTLMRDTANLPKSSHDETEQELFFEFQARAPDLRSRNLSDWEYLFYSRHHGVPTRLIDWTDTLGVSIYFALELFMDGQLEGKGNPTAEPAIWILNPYSLNEKTWDFRDIILPRYLGLQDQDYWDFGELLIGSGDWAWDGPVAIYPIQLSDRVRAQRGWFTIHGNNRSPLEAQYPKLVWKIILEKQCIEEALHFLQWAGFNKFSIYPDFDNLAIWLRQKNLRSTAAILAQRKAR